MGRHRWPTTGDAAGPRPSATSSATRSRLYGSLGSPPGPEGSYADAEEYGDDEGYHAAGAPYRSAPGVQWRVARSAALVFLGVALTIGGALFLTRSAEPSPAVVSVALDPQDGSATPPAAGSGTDGESSEGRPAVDPAPSGDAVPRAQTQGGMPIIVYVTGAVNSPGVVTVPPGTRLFEVVEQAGGALPDADLEGVNLAATPADGDHIHLLAIGEEPRPGPVTAPGGASSGAPSSGVRGSGGPAADGLIDINTATLAEIESLPRIGPVLGQRIIDWREEHGPFSRPKDLDAVPGIGSAMLDALLPAVVVR